MSERDSCWPSLPTETEIYILPNGEIVVADLPAELADLLAKVARPSQEFPPEEIQVSHVANQ